MILFVLLTLCAILSLTFGSEPDVVVLDQKMSWTWARGRCKKLNNYKYALAIFQSPDEFDEVQQACREKCGSEVRCGCWTALKRSNNGWAWHDMWEYRIRREFENYPMHYDGSVTVGEDPWCDICPNNDLQGTSIGEDCANIWKDLQRDFELNDAQCHTLNYAVCKKLKIEFALCGGDGSDESCENSVHEVVLYGNIVLGDVVLGDYVYDHTYPYGTPAWESTWSEEEPKIYQREDKAKIYQREDRYQIVFGTQNKEIFCEQDDILDCGKGQWKIRSHGRRGWSGDYGHEYVDTLFVRAASYSSARTVGNNVDTAEQWISSSMIWGISVGVLLVFCSLLVVLAVDYCPEQQNVVNQMKEIEKEEQDVMKDENEIMALMLESQ